MRTICAWYLLYMCRKGLVTLCWGYIPAASWVTHVFTTTTLAPKGPVRPQELLSGDTDVAASKPEQVRVFLSHRRFNFYDYPYGSQPGEVEVSKSRTVCVW